jgi:hypothetical protein
MAATLLFAPSAAALGPDRAPAPSWTTHLRAMDTAVAAQDIRAALKARHEAEAAARAGNGWEGPLAVGQASLRLGAAIEAPDLAERWARRAFVLAFTRARASASREGMLRTAEAFAALGDHESAQRCTRLASEPGRQPDRARVPALATPEE